MGVFCVAEAMMVLGRSGEDKVFLYYPDSVIFTHPRFRTQDFQFRTARGCQAAKYEIVDIV
jgi:hypothetical protein